MQWVQVGTGPGCEIGRLLGGCFLWNGRMWQWACLQGWGGVIVEALVQDVQGCGFGCRQTHKIK